MSIYQSVPCQTSPGKIISDGNSVKNPWIKESNQVRYPTAESPVTAASNNDASFLNTIGNFETRSSAVISQVERCRLNSVGQGSPHFGSVAQPTVNAKQLEYAVYTTPPTPFSASGASNIQPPYVNGSPNRSPQQRGAIRSSPYYRPHPTVTPPAPMPPSRAGRGSSASVAGEPIVPRLPSIPVAPIVRKKGKSACSTCKKRKISCAAPSPGSVTCNQCLRTGTVCDYPIAHTK